MRLHDIVRTEVGGIFEECDDCILREDGICHGGCIAHSIAKFQDEVPIRMKEIYS
jgi:radical SAM protein with 4Fe4S-binding SPASM domain